MRNKTLIGNFILFCRESEEANRKDKYYKIDSDARSISEIDESEAVHADMPILSATGSDQRFATDLTLNSSTAKTFLATNTGTSDAAIFLSKDKKIVYGIDRVIPETWLKKQWPLIKFIDEILLSKGEKLSDETYLVEVNFESKLTIYYGVNHTGVINGPRINSSSRGDKARARESAAGSFNYKTGGGTAIKVVEIDGFEVANLFLGKTYPDQPMYGVFPRAHVHLVGTICLALYTAWFSYGLYSNNSKASELDKRKSELTVVANQKAIETLRTLSDFQTLAHMKSIDTDKSFLIIEKLFSKNTIVSDLTIEKGSGTITTKVFLSAAGFKSPNSRRLADIETIRSEVSKAQEIGISKSDQKIAQSGEYIEIKYKFDPYRGDDFASLSAR